MNIQLKQKIIGIIIIVVFAAIAIPVLLSGARSKSDTNETAQLDIQQDTSATTTALTEPVQPIDTQATVDSIPSQQPSSVDDVSSSTTNLADTAITNTTNDTDTSTTTAIAVPISPVASTDTTATVAADTSSTTHPPALEQPIKQKEKPTIAHNSHKNTKAKNGINKHKLQAKTLANKSWLVDLGEYSNQQKAQNLVAKLKKGGYHAYAKKVKIKQKSLTVVLVGPVKDHEKTKKLAQKITKNFGIKAKVVTA